MEFEQHPILRNTLENNLEVLSESTLSKVSDSESPDDLIHHIEAFHEQETGGVKRTESAENKLRWLRAQIIGGNFEFDSPFGKRRLTYADHTASGRCLQFIENYIMSNVLPVYGEFPAIYAFSCSDSDSDQ